MAGILIAAGMDPSSATVATLITRLTTLWWGVTLGWLVLATRPSLFRKLLAIDTTGPKRAEPEQDPEDDAPTHV